MKKIMMAAILTCLIAQPAWAGWVVSYKDVQGAKSQEYYDRGKINVEGLIYAGGRVINVDDEAKAYWEATPKQRCKGVRKQIKAMQEAMEATYKSHPEYRPVPISQKKVTRKKIGTKSIAGFSATGYEFFIDGVRSGQVWVSSDASLSDFIDFQKPMMKGMAKDLNCFKDMPGQNTQLEQSALYKKTVKNAFVLEKAYDRQVVSIEKKRIPPEKFEAPAGYKSFSDYEKFQDYARKHSSASTSSSGWSGTPDPESPSQQSSSMRDEPQTYSNDEMDRSDSAPDDDEMPNMDDIKEGAGKMLEGLGSLFGN